jgi:hypothetical protein
MPEIGALLTMVTSAIVDRSCAVLHEALLGGIFSSHVQKKTA